MRKGQQDAELKKKKKGTAVFSLCELIFDDIGKALTPLLIEGFYQILKLPHRVSLTLCYIFEHAHKDDIEYSSKVLNSARNVTNTRQIRRAPKLSQRVNIFHYFVGVFCVLEIGNENDGCDTWCASSFQFCSLSLMMHNILTSQFSEYNRMRSILFEKSSAHPYNSFGS